MNWPEATADLWRRLQRVMKGWRQTGSSCQEGCFKKYFIGPSTQMGNARRRMQRQLALRQTMAEMSQSQRRHYDE